MGEDFERDYAFAADAKPVEGLRPGELPAFFEGFRRADGRAGTRNYIGILSSVNCSATAVDYIADEIMRSGILKDYPDIDGIVPLPGRAAGGMAAGEKPSMFCHARNGAMQAIRISRPCCWSVSVAKSSRSPHEGYLWHCRGRSLSIIDDSRDGGTRKAVEAGVARIKEMLPFAAEVKRQPIAASELTLALQCGRLRWLFGPDGQSGARRGGGHAGAAGWHRHPLGNP